MQLVYTTKETILSFHGTGFAPFGQLQVMKRIGLIITCVFMALVAEAQFIDLGIKSGVQFSNDPARLSLSKSGGTTAMDAGYNTLIGGSIRFNFNRLSISPEFLFSSTEFVPQGSFGLDDVALFSNDRFDLPLVFGYEFFQFLRIEAGPNFYNIKDNEEEKLFRLRNLQKTFTLGAAIDMGKWEIGARMVNDFGDIFEMDANTYQFSLTYTLF